MASVPTRLSTGVSGLDTVLHGGYLDGDAYVLRGDPGTGKTLLGLQFLRDGVAVGDTSLFVGLEESEAKIRRHAASVGFDLDGIEFLDLSPRSDVFTTDDYDIFGPDEVEQQPVKEAIADAIDDLDPDRVVVDPVSRLRRLFPSDHQFRQNVTGFVDFLEAHGSTVLFTTQDVTDEPDDDLQYLGDGIIDLAHDARGRTLTVPKFRGSATENGVHAMKIRDDGVAVFPELKPETHERAFTRETLASGVPEVDQLLAGGIERGTITMLSGPTGAGKTTLGSQFMKAAAGRGERSVIYMFEEGRETFYERSQALDIPVAEMVEAGDLAVEEIEALERSSEEFASMVRHEVETNDTDVVMIDGVAGYDLSIQGDEAMLRQKLHSLCRYLKNMGVTVILIDEVDAVIGEFRATNAGVSYLADNIVFLQYIEYRGEIRKVIGVLKKRTSDFERRLRSFSLTADGVTVGEPLTDLRGILTGAPHWESSDADLEGSGSDD